MNSIGKRMKQVRWRLLLPCLILLLLALLCFGLRGRQANLLQSQQQAERWAGESGQTFTQLTAFLPDSAGLDLEKIYTFRNAAMEALQNVDAEAFPAADGDRLLCDAWSTLASGKLTGEHGSADAAVLAVGGSFFDFHPMALRAGSYLRPEDLMRDRIVLDEALAWSLYGSNDLAGLTVNLDGTDYIVAGVIAREQDAVTKKVSDETPLCFVCYDTWSASHTDAAITCYELTLPEPVKDFSETLMKASFPIGDGMWVQNTGRFSLQSSWKLLKNFGTRGTQTVGVIFPYWENAAIVAENRCASLLLIALLLLALPAAVAVFYAVRGMCGLHRRVKAALPGLKNRALDRRDELAEQIAEQQGKRRG